MFTEYQSRLKTLDSVKSVCYHYTNVSTLGSILKGKKDEGNTPSTVQLRFSQIDCMNDASEKRFAKKVIEKLLSNDERYGCLKGFDDRDHLEEIFKRDIFPLNSVERAFIWGKIYVCCFSGDPDSLSMWNYYSKGGKSSGCNIGFDVRRLCQELNKEYNQYGAYFVTTRISYDSKTLKRYEVSALEEILTFSYEESVRKWLAAGISRLIELSFKNDCFAHEKEARIVMFYEGDELRDRARLAYREQSGYFIPYFDIPIEADGLVKSVTMGPLRVQNGEWQVQRKVLLEMLAAYRLDDRSIKKSKLPIRY